MKKGTARYLAHIDDETLSVTYSEYVLRSTRKKINHWTLKAQYVTWGKLSSLSGDYGFYSNIPAWCKVTTSLNKLPFSKTRRGALRVLIGEIRGEIKDDGADFIVDDAGLHTLADQLKKAQTAYKRCHK